MTAPRPLADELEAVPTTTADGLAAWPSMANKRQAAPQPNGGGNR